MTTIVAHDLSKSFGGLRSADSSHTVNALAGVTLGVEAGEWVAVMGPSGCGKTTLLHLLGGLDRPDTGEVTIAGESISTKSERWRARFRRRHIGYVFQQYNLIPELDVRGNVELPLLLAGVPRQQARRRALTLLDDLHIADIARAAPAVLSGGQQQRVAIARALSGSPTVVLADEPTGALDSASARVVIEAFASAHRNGQTIVMVTHAAEIAAAADRVIEMRDGCIVSAVMAMPMSSGVQ